jgi:hypothetical protein
VQSINLKATTPHLSARASRTEVLLASAPFEDTQRALESLLQGDDASHPRQVIVATGGSIPFPLRLDWESRGVHVIELDGASPGLLRSNAMAAATGHVVRFGGDGSSW